MNKIRYLGYQALREMAYSKKRYLLYVAAFYIGLLLPAFCVANLSYLKNMLSYYVFDGMDRSIQVDWFSTSFATGDFEELSDYSVKAMYQEIFKEWDDQSLTINGIGKNDFYNSPQIEGRMFTEQEMAQGASVCMIDKQNAMEYHCGIGDKISLGGTDLRIVGLITDTFMPNAVRLPFRTMGKIYEKQGVKIQFSGTFLMKQGETKEELLPVIEASVLEKDKAAQILFVEEGKKLYDKAVHAVVQWKALRVVIALTAVLFFLMNEVIIIVWKTQEERKTFAVKMALGAGMWEVGLYSFLEILSITLLADVLVLFSLQPLAKLFLLDKWIVLDRFVVTVTLIGSFVVCGLIAVAAVKSLDRFQIGDMLKVGNDS